MPDRNLRSALGVVALFAALPFLHFAAANPDYEIAVVRLLFYFLLCVIPLEALVLWVGSRSRRVARRVAVVVAISFYAVAYFADGLSETLRLGSPLGVDGAIWASAGLIIVAILASRWKWVHTYVLVLGVLLVVGLCTQSILGRVGTGADPSAGLDEAMAISPNMTPNVYWFLLDGYGREDVLRSEYDYPGQSEFVAQLEDRGFTVSGSAVTAYPLTYLSMSSTLGAQYFALDGMDLYDPDLFIDVIKGENSVVRTLESWGYEYVHVDNGWAGSGCSTEVDVCVSTGYAGELEWELLSTTPFAFLFDRPLSHAEARRTNPRVAADLIREAQPTSPFFAQIHLINPHPPHFTTGEDCRVRVVPYDLTAAFGDEDYVDAIRCLNRRLLEAIDEIRAGDDGAIIILQGDHGPAEFAIDVAPVDRWTDHDLQVRFGVLSAMALPDGCTAPDDMALVNTFRVVFDCLAVEDVPLLPTRAWVVNTHPGAHMEVVPPT